MELSLGSKSDTNPEACSGRESGSLLYGVYGDMTKIRAKLAKNCTELPRLANPEKLIILYKNRHLRPCFAKEKYVFGTEGWGFESLRVYFRNSRRTLVLPTEATKRIRNATKSDRSQTGVLCSSATPARRKSVKSTGSKPPKSCWDMPARMSRRFTPRRIWNTLSKSRKRLADGSRKDTRSARRDDTETAGCFGSHGQAG
jgi:hypothetical protein